MLFYGRINRFNRVFHALHFDPIIIKTINSWSTKDCNASNPIDLSHPKTALQIRISLNKEIRWKYIPCLYKIFNSTKAIFWWMKFCIRRISIEENNTNDLLCKQLINHLPVDKYGFQHMYPWFQNNRNSWMVDKLESYMSNIKMK